MRSRIGWQMGIPHRAKESHAESPVVSRMWTYATVRRILITETYAGIYHFGRTDTTTKVLSASGQTVSNSSFPCLRLSVAIFGKQHKRGASTTSAYRAKSVICYVALLHAGADVRWRVNTLSPVDIHAVWIRPF